MVLFGRKWYYSGKVVFFRQGGCIRQNGCIREKVIRSGLKWFYSDKSGCFLAKVVVFGQSGCVRAKGVVF